MGNHSGNNNVTIIGAGPYGLAAATYLRAANVETRIFGEPMSFWERQMPAGMCLRSNWTASHIADPRQELTLDAYCRENGNHMPKPIPLERFVAYGRWYQRRGVGDVDSRKIQSVEAAAAGFKIVLNDGEQFSCRRVVVATGISAFSARPAAFDNLPSELASHSSEHTDLGKFSGRRVLVVGCGQSALESAALLKEAGAEVEVIARKTTLNWVGVHPRLHHLGIVSRMLYSNRDVGPAGISRLVSAPYLFRKLPRDVQDRIAYRAIRPAGSGWLRPRLVGVAITLGRSITSAKVANDQLHLKLDDGTDRLVDHALLATGFRVDVTKYPFLSSSLLSRLQTANGFPVLSCGLESSIPGLHFVGKSASWSFGPLLGFVSGTEFASTELVRSLKQNASGN
jgi:FAD-dependent urate hydroxylase